MCRSGIGPKQGGHDDALHDPRRYRYGVRFAPGQGFGRRVAGPIGERDRGQQADECANGRNLERAARDAPVAKFKDRNTAVQRLWAAFGQLPVSSAPAGGSAGPSAGSKQARVIGLLQRPEGATIDEIASAMGWQRHTVRGLISGALKKRLGLDIVSERTDRGRFYRISEGRSAVR